LDDSLLAHAIAEFTRTLPARDSVVSPRPGATQGQRVAWPQVNDKGAMAPFRSRASVLHVGCHEAPQVAGTFPPELAQTAASQRPTSPGDVVPVVHPLDVATVDLSVEEVRPQSIKVQVGV
jgi:hypothetical protein